MLTTLVFNALLAIAATAASPTATTTAPAASAMSKLEPTPQFRRYGTVEGLADTYVYAMVQDKQGYIWISSNNLTRYDGFGFKHWHHDSKNPNSASDSSTSGITLAAGSDDQRLWIASFDDGLARYTPRTNAFEHWRHDRNNPNSLASNAIAYDGNNPLAVDAQGKLWIALNDAGLDRMRDDQKGFEHLRHDPQNPDSLVSDELTTLLPEADGSLWIGTRQGLDLRHADGHIQHWPFERPPPPRISRPPTGHHKFGE